MSSTATALPVSQRANLHVSADQAAAMAGIDLETAKVADFGTAEPVSAARGAIYSRRSYRIAGDAGREREEGLCERNFFDPPKFSGGQVQPQVLQPPFQPRARAMVPRPGRLPTRFLTPLLDQGNPELWQAPQQDPYSLREMRSPLLAPAEAEVRLVRLPRC